MKSYPSLLIILICSFLDGCQIYHTIRPVRLYDMSDGSVIEVVIHERTRDGGKLVPVQANGEKFEGEYVIYGRTGYPQGSYGMSDARQSTSLKDSSELRSFAELYGFGDHSGARPVGTGVLVGDQGTMIEIVFYRVNQNLEAGDGVAKDNRGHRYRVFLSSEQR